MRREAHSLFLFPIFSRGDAKVAPLGTEDSWDGGLVKIKSITGDYGVLVQTGTSIGNARVVNALGKTPTAVITPLSESERQYSGPLVELAVTMSDVPDGTDVTLLRALHHSWVTHAVGKVANGSILFLVPSMHYYKVESQQ